MKLILICILFVCIVIISLINLTYYSNKIRIFKDLVDFYKVYIREISFSKCSVKEIINKVCNNCFSDTVKILKNYNNIAAYPSSINQEEKQLVFEDLVLIGQKDVDNEILFSNNAIDKLTNKLSYLEQDYKNKGLTRSKLIFILGIAIIIILI